MKHISILVPLGHTSMVNIEGTHQILSGANDLLLSRNRESLFNVQLAGICKETRQDTGLFTVNPDVLINDVVKTDLIIIPAMHGDQIKVRESNKEFIPWIIQQYRGGAEVVSLCVGAYFLAATGLLKDKHCATHWLHANAFRSMYPALFW